MNELISINELDIGKNMSSAIITVHQSFTYEGISNDDIAVMLLVLNKSYGKWKITKAQRSQGRPVSEVLPTF